MSTPPDRPTRECQHPRANHQHGTREAYVLDKCRCAPCTEAARVYAQQLRRSRLYGRYDRLVDAQPARDHIKYLQANGISLKRTAQLSGVSLSSIGRIVHGRTERNEPPAKRIRPTMETRILAVRSSIEDMSPGRVIPATGTHRRIQALAWLGYSLSWQAEQIGWLPTNYHHVLKREDCTAATHLKIKALFEKLWDQPNQPTEPHAKAAASRARNTAAREGWLPPMAWDDIDTDTIAPVVDLQEREDLFTAEVEHLHTAGTSLGEIARRLGIAPASVLKRLQRNNRNDFASRLNSKAAA